MAGSNEHEYKVQEVTQSLPRPLYRLYQGEIYRATHVATGTADGTQVDMVIQTGSDPVWLVGVKADGEGQVRYQLREGASIGTAGTAVDVENMNRISSKTPSSSVEIDPTYTSTDSDDGEELVDIQSSGAGGENPVGRSPGSTTGAVAMLKPNTNYVLRAINASGGSSDIGIAAEFAEEPYDNMG